VVLTLLVATAAAMAVAKRRGPAGDDADSSGKTSEKTILPTAPAATTLETP